MSRHSSAANCLPMREAALAHFNLRRNLVILIDPS